MRNPFGRKAKFYLNLIELRSFLVWKGVWEKSPITKETRSLRLFYINFMHESKIIIGDQEKLNGNNKYYSLRQRWKW